MDETSLDADGRLLLKRAGQLLEVSVVYFRAGYGPEDYPTRKEWQSRRRLEESRAIKCPTIITQLAGAKKVQQVLAGHGVTEQFIGETDAAEIRKTFAGMYPLDDSEAGQRGRELALHEPSGYVLKPQREGGGHNIYRDKIPEFLRSIPEEHWSGYILMELIQPPQVQNAILRAGQVIEGEVIGELGIYGTILWSQASGRVTIHENEEAGYLLRTKFRHSDEGGVAAGFGCIDSVALTE